MDNYHLVFYLLFLLPGFTLSVVRLQGDAIVKRGSSINLNCSSDIKPLGQSAEILVNSSTYTNIRLFNGQCFSGIKKGPCSPDLCKCSEHGTWFSYRYTVREDVHITCTMRFDLPGLLSDSILVRVIGLLSDSISVRVIDMVGPVITTNTSFPLVAGTTVRFLCTVETRIIPSITWNCLAAQVLTDWVEDTYRYVSMVEYKVDFVDGGKTCTCLTNADNFQTSTYVQLDIERAPILDIDSNVECNSSYLVKISCHISGELFVYGFYPWIHSAHGIFIRKLHGIVNGSISILKLPSCTYQDVGQYTCMAWNTISGSIYNASKNTTVTAYEAPVIIKTETRRDSRLILTSYIYSQSNISTPVWSSGNNVIINSSNSVQTVKHTTIEVSFYNIPVRCDGYIAMLTMEDFQSGQYMLILHNMYGETHRIISVDLDTKTSFDFQIVIWIIVASVIFILTLTTTVSLMRRCRVNITADSMQDRMASPRIYLSVAEQANTEHDYERTTPQYLELSSYEQNRAIPQYLELSDYEPRRQHTHLERKMYTSLIESDSSEVNNSSVVNSSPVYEEID